MSSVLSNKSLYCKLHRLSCVTIRKSKGQIIEDKAVALNEVVLHRGSYQKRTTIRVTINEKYLGEFDGDGVYSRNFYRKYSLQSLGWRQCYPPSCGRDANCTHRTPQFVFKSHCSSGKYSFKIIIGFLKDQLPLPLMGRNGTEIKKWR